MLHSKLMGYRFLLSSFLFLTFPSPLGRFPFHFVFLPFFSSLPLSFIKSNMHMPISTSKEFFNQFSFPHSSFLRVFYICLFFFLFFFSSFSHPQRSCIALFYSNSSKLPMFVSIVNICRIHHVDILSLYLLFYDLLESPFRTMKINTSL